MATVLFRSIQRETMHSWYGGFLAGRISLGNVSGAKIRERRSDRKISNNTFQSVVSPLKTVFCTFRKRSFSKCAKR